MPNFTIVEHYTGKVGYDVEAPDAATALKWFQEGKPGDARYPGEADFDEVVGVERLEVYLDDGEINAKPVPVDFDDPPPKQNMKMVEIRDRMTFIAAIAIKTLGENGAQKFLLRRSGYSEDGSDVILVPIGGRTLEAEHDPYAWENRRTLHTAHLWLREHFDEVSDGDVIDVEFILGETTEKKHSERFGG